MCGFGEGPAAFTETRPRARKDHRCCECYRTIPAGTVYVRTTGIWDGRPDSFAQHEECRELLSYVSDVYCDGEMWSFGTLREEVAQYTDEPDGEGRFYWGTALACRMAAIEARYDR